MRIRIWKVLLVLMALIFLASLVVILVVPQKSKCELQDILLRGDQMPDGWKKIWIILPPALPLEGSQDAVSVYFENGEETALHTIYRYKNDAAAFFYFRFKNAIFFPSTGWNWSEWDGNKNWTFGGDEEVTRCGEGNDQFFGNRCGTVQRYGSLISHFSASIKDGVMDKKQYEAVIKSIMNNFSLCGIGIH